MVINMDDFYDSFVKNDQLSGWLSLSKTISRQELANKMRDWHIGEHEKVMKETGMSGGLGDLMAGMIMNADWISLAIRIRKEADMVAKTQPSETESNVVPVNFGK